MGASRRGGLGRPGARPDRIITFRSDIAFPSAHDHGALCPRQARSAPIGQTLRWLSDRKRTVIRNPIPWQAADAARANTRSFGRAAGVARPALPRRARAGPAAPGPDPPGPAPPGLPAPRALFRLACPDRGLCSAWPARTAGSVPPGLPGPRALLRLACPGSRPHREEWACPLSHARAAAVSGRRRRLRGRPASPAGMPKPGPAGLGPPKARLPSAVTGDGRAPPVTAAGPPMSFHKSRTCLIPGLHTPRRCPGGSTHLSPPGLRPIGERMEFMWRIPRHRDGAFPAGRPHDHRSYRGS